MHSQLTAQRGKALPLGSVLCRWGLIGLVLFVSACTTGSSTTATPTAVPTSHVPSGMIKHIVFFVKENRTFDNYFGTYPGANGARFATDSAGKIVPPQHEQDVLAGDIDHSSAAARQAYDNGKMDDFDQLASFSAQTGQPQQSHRPYGNNSLTQFYQSDIPNYWTYAHNFVLGDNMFSSLMGPSFPNHLYTIAAQSGGAIDNPQSSGAAWGCDVANEQVQIQASNGSTILGDACFNFTTLADELDAKGYSWRYYAPPAGSARGQSAGCAPTSESCMARCPRRGSWPRCAPRDRPWWRARAGPARRGCSRRTARQWRPGTWVGGVLSRIRRCRDRAP